MLIKQIYQKNVIFVSIWYFKDIGFKYEPYLCDDCHNLIQKAMSFNNIAIVYVKEILIKLIFGIWVKMMQLT